MGLLGDIAGVFGIGAQAASAHSQNKIAAESLAWDKEIGSKNFALQEKYSDLNFENMLQQQEYEKEMAREAWVREDTATQRRSADLKAAGINPLMAAGQSAASMAPARVSTPQAQAPQYTGRNPYGAKMEAKANEQAFIANALSLLKMRSDIERSGAETELIKAQAEGTRSDTMFKSKTMDDRITKVMHDATIRGEEAVTEMYRQDIARIGVDRAVVQAALDNVRLLIADKTLTQKEKDLVALDLLIEKAGYDLQKWQEFGLPTNAGLDPVTRGGGIIGSAVGELLKKLK